MRTEEASQTYDAHADASYGDTHHFPTVFILIISCSQQPIPVFGGKIALKTSIAVTELMVSPV